MGFAKGFMYPFTSLRFMNQHPGLARFVVLPFLINVGVFCVAVYYGFGAFQDFILSKIPQGDAWYWFLLNYFLLGLGILVTLALVFFTFAVVGSLIASPFNDILSEKTEQILVGDRQGSPFLWREFLENTRRTLLNELKKITVFVAGMFFLLLLHLLPGIGSILYSCLSVLWTIFFLVVEYTGYVFARRVYSFKQQRRVVFTHPTLMAGFGTALFCVLLVPFLQFLTIPLGVVGATRLLVESDCLKETAAGVVVAEGQ